MEWYSLQVYTTNELFVKRSIEALIEQKGLQDKILQVVVPVEEIISYVKNVEKRREKAIYPGYVFIQGDMSDVGMQVLIQNINKVAGFVGEKGLPAPLSKKDIDNILKIANKPIESKFQNNYEEGELVLIKEGSFENFKGTVTSYDPKAGLVHVNVNILGRETPVELSVAQVEKQV